MTGAPETTVEGLSPGGEGSGEPAADDGVYYFRLYVAGRTPKSLAAIENLTLLCDAHLPGRHSIEVFDLAERPELAALDQIVAIPTLVRSLPPPLKRMIGSLSDPEKFLVGLEFSRPGR